MKSASTDLKNFLFSKQGYVRTDLYEVTLAGGSVQRWTSADVSIVWSGYTWLPYPGISDGGVKTSRGLSTNSVELTLMADSRYTIGGVPILKFVLNNGFDGAVVRIYRVFYPSWGAAEIGAYTRFYGRFSEVIEHTQSQVILSLASWTELLDVNMPVDVWQSSCLNTLFDTKCAVNRASYAASGTVSSGSTDKTLNTNITSASGTFNLGALVFTSGVNNGLRRTIKTQLNTGVISLVSPLPVAPASGDTFTAYPGCDLKKTTCATKFSNLARFRGQPFVPVPETAV